MGLDRLKSVIALVADSTIVELKYSEGDTHISLVRRAEGVVPSPLPTPSPAAEAAGDGAPREPTPRKAEQAPPPAASDGDFVVVAPMASIFHRSPSPTAPPFVDVGDGCEPGTKLCILEAMKVFTMLDSECAGTIAEFYVNDGDEVQIDQPLIRIRRR
ncbi:hypothetical protein CAL29_05790 [Bordetella genomosp. 10]|uniref:Biotin carboxyl carrier protein of acetyl-CoA carboxylase n=1 Tax=Bordetella genomosp. 10 TaxID=1416804 RepID=A0A261SKC0_9BORD|nr:biotin/lipoyl-containing protein [Bordetella genomosp. 10]OZI37878.1 hypothetical protein CAL29_05790 [Bordetella genomosp. 10]